MFLEIWLHDWLIKCRLSRGRYSNFLQVLRCPPTPPCLRWWKGDDAARDMYDVSHLPGIGNMYLYIYIYLRMYIYIYTHVNCCLSYMKYYPPPKIYIYIYTYYVHINIYIYISVSLLYITPFFTLRSLLHVEKPSDGSGPTQRWRLRRDALKGGRYHIHHHSSPPQGFLKLSI